MFFTARVVAASQKQRFIAMVSDSKSHVIILRRVIGVKFNIGKKSNRVRNNDIESSTVFKLIELMFKESYTVFRNILESGQEGWTFIILYNTMEGRTVIILYNTMDFYEWKINLT